MFKTVHVCFTARFIVVLCLGFIFLLMCNELFTSKADDVGSGYMKEEKNICRWIIQLLYCTFSGIAFVTSRQRNMESLTKERRTSSKRLLRLFYHILTDIRKM